MNAFRKKQAAKAACFWHDEYGWFSTVICYRIQKYRTISSPKDSYPTNHACIRCHLSEACLFQSCWSDIATFNRYITGFIAIHRQVPYAVECGGRPPVLLIARRKSACHPISCIFWILLHYGLLSTLTRQFCEMCRRFWTLSWRQQKLSKVLTWRITLAPEAHDPLLSSPVAGVLLWAVPCRCCGRRLRLNGLLPFQGPAVDGQCLFTGCVGISGRGSGAGGVFGANLLPLKPLMISHFAIKYTDGFAQAEICASSARGETPLLSSECNV